MSWTNTLDIQCFDARGTHAYELGHAAESVLGLPSGM